MSDDMALDLDCGDVRRGISGSPSIFRSGTSDARAVWGGGGGGLIGIAANLLRVACARDASRQRGGNARRAEATRIAIGDAVDDTSTASTPPQLAARSRTRWPKLSTGRTLAFEPRVTRPALCGSPETRSCSERPYSAGPLPAARACRARRSSSRMPRARASSQAPASAAPPQVSADPRAAPSWNRERPNRRITRLPRFSLFLRRRNRCATLRHEAPAFVDGRLS